MYRKVDHNVALIQFGSSLRRIDSNIEDIDLLLLTEIDCNVATFEAVTDLLRRRLLRGIIRGEMELKSGRFGLLTNRFLEQQRIVNDVSLIPKFVLGPIHHDSSDSITRIYLHFKGPLTANQFLYFCKKFPLHSNSMLNNSKTILGRFRKTMYLHASVATQGDIVGFNSGLARRAPVATAGALP